MPRLAEGSFAPIRPDEQDFFAFDFAAEIGISANFNGSITGNMLTVDFTIDGMLQVGQLIVSPAVLTDTRIVSFGTGKGGAGTYTLNNSQTVPSTIMVSGAIISTVVWSSQVIVGTDPTPENRILSEPTIARNTTSVLVGTMIDGVTYLLTATATLSDGRVLVSSADVICILKPVVEDQVLTVAEFRAIFPAFSDPTMFPDDTIAYWINQAVTMPVIDADRWGQFYNMGICLWVAHVLAIGQAQRRAMQSGQLGSGVPASKSVNGVSLSYDTQLGVEADAGWYALTPWGNAFLRYLRMAGAGPIQVGTGYYWNPPGVVIDVTPQRYGPFITRLRPW